MRNDNRLSGFLTVALVAALLGISRSTTLTLIRAGQIPAIRVGNQIRVSETGLVRYLQDAGLDVELIYRGGLKPTTVPPTPVPSAAQNAERDPVTGVNVR